MEISRYKIADLIVDMVARFDMLQQRAKPYLFEFEGDADIRIYISDERLLKLHKTNPTLSPADCEYMLAGSDFYYALLEHDGFMLHASAVMRDGRAYLFSAPCGTGKSTHTQLWKKAFLDAQILNDDKPAVRCIDGKLYAYGSPFSGKHDMSTNVRANLVGIAFIERSKDNYIEPILDTHEALRRILEQTIRPNDAVRMTKLLGYMDELITKIPVYLFRCNISEQAAKIAYEGMRGHEA